MRIALGGVVIATQAALPDGTPLKIICGQEKISAIPEKHVDALAVGCRRGRCQRVLVVDRGSACRNRACPHNLPIYGAQANQKPLFAVFTCRLQEYPISPHNWR